MSHTQAQAGFLNRKAAFVPCGTWIHPEMKDSWPKGRKIAFMLPPTVDGGKGDPTAIQVAIEPWMVPAKAQNKELAIDFFKYMTSVEKSKHIVEEKGTLMAIK
jgi:N-acetylglucosamine transport system substrate-binding protein